MMPHPTLMLIRCDASPDIGSGHVMRCLALAQAWRERGHQAIFVAAELSASIQERLRSEKFECQLTSTPIGSTDDATELRNVADRSNAHTIVLDGYRFTDDYVAQINAGPAKVMLIDDFGQLNDYPTDFVLNQNLGADLDWYARRDARTRLLLGSEYVLLRQEFLVAAQPSNSGPSEQTDAAKPPRRQRILLLFGGSDPDNLTGKTLDCLHAIRDQGQDVGSEFEVRAILGGLNRHVEAVQQQADTMDHVDVLGDVRDMAAQYRWADWAITAGGSANWEMCYFGLPRMVVITAENQVPAVAAMEQAGAAMTLGCASELDPDRFARAIRRFMQDDQQRQQIAAASRLLVDGRGGRRVVDALLGG